MQQLNFSTYERSPSPQSKHNNNSMVSTFHESSGARTTQNFFKRKRSGKSTRGSRAETPEGCRSTFVGDEEVFMQNKPDTSKPPGTSSLWRQSASTWRHSSPRHSFSKDSRFKQDRCSHMDIQELNIPSSFGSKSCTFGKGDRKPISIVTLRNAKITPSPDRYDLSTYLETTRKAALNNGKTFGIPWDAYKNVYIRHRTDVYSGHFTDGNPPAHYQVRETPGKDKKKYTAYGRLKMFSQVIPDQMRMVPGPVHVINDSLQRSTRGLNERNFGFGERIDLAKPLNDNPGPGAHDIKGFCAGFKTK